MQQGPPNYPGPQPPQGSPLYPRHGYPGAPPPFAAPSEPDEAASFAPTLIVNAACIGLVVLCLLLILLMARLLLATSGTTGGLLAVGHGLLALAALGGAIGVRSGRLPLAILGLVVCPLAGLASLFALLTGSIAGLGGGVVSLLTLVLIVIALGDVWRMGAARKALRLGAPLPVDAGPSSGPISDLPRVKPRRWPVLVALVAIVVLGGGGVAFGMRYASRAERAKEAAAFRTLETCLLGGTPPASVSPSLAFRRMEIRLAVAPPSANSWPGRCAAHAHALHESKRRSGASEKDAGDTAILAERLGRLLADARGASVYEAVDDLWAATAKEAYEPTASEAGSTAPSWLDIDALAKVGPFSKAKLPLSAVRSDRVASPALHFLVDGSRQRGDGRLCTLERSALRCTALAPPLGDTALALLGSAEGDAAPLVFANGGQAGIFRPSGESVAELASYGSITRADGTVGVVGYDVRSSKFVLLRAAKGGATERATFPLKGVSDDRQVALLGDNLVWATEPGMLSTARLLPSGAPLGAPVELGTVGGIGSIESFDGCRSRDAFFVRANGTAGSALAIDTGDRWSSLVAVRSGSLSCAGKEAFILGQRVRAGGTGSVSIDRCGSTGCQSQSVDLDDVFQQNPELLPKVAPLALVLNGKLLLLWRAGQRGGVRMRLAAPEHIAATEDVLLFDDRVQSGSVSERSVLLEMRGWSQEDRAVLFLSTTAGVWALSIDDSGKVTPLETVREAAR